MEKNQILNSEFWQSSASEIFLNPRMPLESQERILAFKGHEHLHSSIGLQSSGTESGDSNDIKLVVFQRESILAAARSVNEVFKLSHLDKWIGSLPFFHIGGTGNKSARL